LCLQEEEPTPLTASTDFQSQASMTKTAIGTETGCTEAIPKTLHLQKRPALSKTKILEKQNRRFLQKKMRTLVRMTLPPQHHSHHLYLPNHHRLKTPRSKWNPNQMTIHMTLKKPAERFLEVPVLPPLSLRRQQNLHHCRQVSLWTM